MAERTVRDFVTEVGIEKLMKNVGVGDRMVRHAARNGVMPAKWFAGAQAAAKDAQVKEPDLSLFDMAKPKNSA